MNVSDWFRPKYRNSNPMIRKSAIESINKESILIDMALNDESIEVRLSALERISDQNILTRIALSDSQAQLRHAAIIRVTNPTVLEQIAVSDSDYSNARDAINALEDPIVLARIANHPVPLRDKNTYPNLQYIAASRIKDDSILEKLAYPESCACYQVRYLVAQKVKNQDAVSYLAEHDPEKNIRQTAVERLTDAAILMRIAIVDYEEIICQKALERITDEKQVAEVARQSLHYKIRSLAADRISNKYDPAELLLPYEELELSCRNGDRKRVIELLDSGLSADASLKNGETVFVQAVCNEHYEIAEELLKRGAKPDRNKAILGRYLWSAINKGDSQNSCNLIRFGADPNVTGAPPHFGDGYSALQFAIMRGAVEVAKALVDAGASVSHDAGFWEDPEYGASTYHSCTVLEIAHSYCKDPKWNGFIDLLKSKK